MKSLQEELHLQLKENDIQAALFGEIHDNGATKESTLSRFTSVLEIMADHGFRHLVLEHLSCGFTPGMTENPLIREHILMYSQLTQKGKSSDLEKLFIRCKELGITIHGAGIHPDHLEKVIELETDGSLGASMICYIVLAQVLHLLESGEKVISYTGMAHNALPHESPHRVSIVPELMKRVRRDSLLAVNMIVPELMSPEILVYEDAITKTLIAAQGTIRDRDYVESTDFDGYKKMSVVYKRHTKFN